jgi:hypothetical protein
VVFVADTTGLDLREQERYWACIREGRPHDYHGIAIHPRHLSTWETYVLHRHRYYDPDLDKQEKIRELRQVYEDSLASAKSGSEDGSVSNDEISEKVSRYFLLERQNRDGKVVSDEKVTEVN